MADHPQRLTIDDFCRALAQKLMAANRMRIPFDNAEMALAMKAVAAEVGESRSLLTSDLRRLLIGFKTGNPWRTNSENALA